MFGNDRRYEWTREAVRPKDPPVTVEVDLTLVFPPAAAPLGEGDTDLVPGSRHRR
ncbi:hypothetical protein [Amycolatopsis sp.]|uniref:hypothetical protein n=1 Tax=Amycolatopsis sp. TaxID=37632 RepID=UPI002D7E84C0|nr:hypothetical protein [Amycolatopsis sp.]HET6705515.1 hypothetical protein [Amycolatopsis sp.]